ncbi:MAG: RNA methyltransferase, partial [Alphaproteobacteria bacterium]|nr:RNA methyltransferase [Alphaproteobacteria bacterium]
RRQAAGERTAILFGAERSGLTNDDTALAHAVVTIPLNPHFSSLNLGQAVLLLSYEWSLHHDNTPAIQLPIGDTAPATHDKLVELCARLETEMDRGGFFRSPDQRPTIIRNLQNMLARATMTEQEVRTFHGIITALLREK